MKKSYNLTKAKVSYGLQGSYRSMKDSDRWVDSWKKAPENSKKEKCTNILYKLTKFFSLNKEIFISGSKECASEFKFTHCTQL